MRGRVKELIRKAFSQGLSPHQLALTIALGVTIGAIPVVWGSTLLCINLAFFFRLNQAVIQAANYLAYPLQIALFVPFYRLGAKVFPWGPSLSGEALLHGLRKGWPENISLIVVATLKAVSAWLFTAPASVILLYLIFRLIFSRMPRFNLKTH